MMAVTGQVVRGDHRRAVVRRGHGAGAGLFGPSAGAGGDGQPALGGVGLIFAVVAQMSLKGCWRRCATSWRAVDHRAGAT